MKLATESQLLEDRSRSKVLTVSGGIQNNEAGIHQSFTFPMPEFNGIRMPTQPIRRLVDIYIVMCPIQRPQCTYSGAPTANDRDFLSREGRSQGSHIKDIGEK
jgi:hypothetical protein